MDPVQTAYTGAFRSGSTLLDQEAFYHKLDRRQNQTTFVVIDALRVY